MTTPERPSLADTLARIDAVLGASQPPCLRCARQALLDSEFCAAHKRIPREMIEDLGPVLEPAPPDPDWVTFEPLSKPGWLARALRRLFT